MNVHAYWQFCSIGRQVELQVAPPHLFHLLLGQAEQLFLYSLFLSLLLEVEVGVGVRQQGCAKSYQCKFDFLTTL